MQGVKASHPVCLDDVVCKGLKVVILCVVCKGLKVVVLYALMIWWVCPILP